MITLGKATRQLVVFPKADNELEESEHRETHEMTSIILLGCGRGRVGLMAKDRIEDHRAWIHTQEPRQ